MSSTATKTNHYGTKDIVVPGIAVKDVDVTGRTVTGMYNCYNFLDCYGDVLLPGCAKRTINAQGPKSRAVAKIKHFLHHDPTRLPGKIMTLDEREVDGYTGIYFETSMIDTQEGNDTLKSYEAGIYDNHSIGFTYKVVEMVERDTKAFDKIVDQLVNPEAAEGRNYIWAVKEIALWEGSTVAFGANSATPSFGVKSGNPGEQRAYAQELVGKLEKLTKAIRNGTQSDDALYAFELQTLQLRQLIDDLIDAVPEVDGKAKERAAATIVKGIGVDDVKNFFGRK